MKNLFVRVLAVVALAIAATVQTMAQQSFSYQAVIRDGNGTLVNSGKVGLKFTLLNGGKDYYVETQTAEPNKYGNISVMIGAGTKVSGDFAKVPWNTLDVTLKVEVDVKGGTDYKPLGETKLNSVPYAMYAPAVGKAVGVGSAAKSAETLFEVDDRNGRPVFAVTNDGIVVYVDDQDDSKVRRSGFLIVGRDATKGEPAKEYFSVTTDGTQIYVDDEGSDKVRRSGFLITGRDATKDGQADYMKVDGTGTTVYVDGQDDSKVRRSGFLITGRDATKGVDANLFAADAGGTTVYVDDAEGDKVRRSGFLITGRDATKVTERFVDVTADATNLRTETFTVANTVPGDDAAAVPAPVLVVSRQQVEIKTDVAMEGDVLPAAYGTFEKEYNFELQLACSSECSIPFDTILTRAGFVLPEERVHYGENDSIMYIFEGGLVVASDRGELNFDKNFQRTSNLNDVAFCIREYEDGGSTLEFNSLTDDLVLHDFPVQFVLAYNELDANYNRIFHTVLVTVKLTVDKMIYSYTTSKGSARYEYVSFDQNNNANNYYLDYSFNEYGWDNFLGLDDSQVINGRGNYNVIWHYNNMIDDYDYQSIENKRSLWYWGSQNWQLETVNAYQFPIMSLSGVNHMCNCYYTNYYGSISGVINYDDNLLLKADDEQEFFTIANKDYLVEKFVYKEDSADSKYRVFTFYVYNGIVLKIDKTYVSGKTVNILKCIEFTEGVTEPSFHRWLKNSGLTNYDGIVSDSEGFLGENYDETHKYVDLNLPSGNLWASYNVGAPSSYDWGDYLAWGELNEKESYSSDADNYSVQNLISSYTSEADYANINDAAWKWGENLKTMTSDWCMPSSADWQELIDNCFWVWIKGEQGVRVFQAKNYTDRGKTDIIDKKSDLSGLYYYYDADRYNYVFSPHIFLPLSGSYDGTTLNNEMKGLYWASDKPSDQSNAYSLEISSPSNKQVKENKRYQGLQVRAVAHKNTKYWVKAGGSNNGNGSEQQPFNSIVKAIRMIPQSNGDEKMTYTIMIDGQLEEPTTINFENVKQITLCGASGLDNNGEPKDAIVGNDGTRPLTVNSGNIRIKNLKLTGGKSTEGGGIYVKDGATVTLDDGAVVSNNHGDKSELGQSGKYGGLGGGVFVDGGKLYMRGTARICNNTAGLASEEQDASYCGYGAGVFVNMGQFIMEGGTISGNEGIGASFNGFYQYTGYKVYYLDFSSGAGVYLNTAYGGRFVMSGGTISGNTIDIDANTSTIFINTIQGNNPNDEVHIEGGGNGVWFEAGCLCRGSWSDFSMSGGAYIDDIYMYCGHEAEPSNGCASGINITDELTTNKVMNISCSDEGNGVGDGAYLLMPGYNPDILDDGIIRRAVDKFKVTHEGYKIVPETVTVTDNYYFQGVVGKMVKSGSK